MLKRRDKKKPTCWPPAKTEVASHPLVITQATIQLANESTTNYKKQNKPRQSENDDRGTRKLDPRTPVSDLGRHHTNAEHKGYRCCNHNRLGLPDKQNGWQNIQIKWNTRWGKNRENRRTGETKTKKKNPSGRVEKEKEKEKENDLEIPELGPQIPVPDLGFHHINAKPNTKQC